VPSVDPPAELRALVGRARLNPAPLSDWESDFLAEVALRTAVPTEKQMATLAAIADRSTPAELSRRLAERMGVFAAALAGNPTSKGQMTWRFRSRGSLAVEVAGAKRGSWFDHEAGEGGNALALVMHLRREPLPAALEWALAWLGEESRPAAPTAPRQRAMPGEAPPPATLEMARRLWREAVPVADTLAAIYLAARGLREELGAPIRFHPDCPRGAERWPAMVALMSDPVMGEPCGVHRTFLARDGSGKAPGPMPTKMMCGAAGVIRLIADDEVTGGLGIAEGIETALSVMQGFGWRPVWAATSAGAIRTFPILPGIEALTIFADPDGAGMEAARICARRWVEAGQEARICAPPRGDFNDLARECAA